MITVGLWRWAVSVVLGGLAGSTGYGLYQLRNVNDAWAWAIYGALAGFVFGGLVLIFSVVGSSRTR